ncbi:MAG TPA: LysR family transcriptional regulator [Xanthomonadales bacterium]|nr:LysR family transcriptional regulator [Xanthomonadales bacterium]
MNFRHIEVFFAVMTCGTVTEAARQLGVSQPSVTTTLKQAESRLGLTLFDREGGRLIPTTEARILFEEADRAHDALSAFRTLARRLQSGQGGHVRVASIHTIALELLPDTIDLFQQQNKGFNFSVSTLNTEDILTQLASRTGACQLAFTIGDPEESFVTTETIGETELLAVFPADWAIPAGPNIDLSWLSDKPYIAGFDGTALAQSCSALFREADIEPQTVAKIHTHYLAGNLVKRRLGFAILDSITVRALRHDSLGQNMVIRRIKGTPSLPVNVVYSSQRGLSNPARLFADCVSDTYLKLVQSLDHGHI